ncbi:hypothetical protein ACFFUT_09115 [Pseudohalocynthiibacter aestuariivivens]|uniref:Protein phosphatase 2C domain-containing protein n=1 Tax=Pseudohalocynthiibacter aestuariivivens TaxID=1591409 RepID=A0ABV5JER0_9RHOB|nr:hypothetical protein [Pseudohalocynthiibacter aestuariivivens]MBS9718492.1 hypothetical protein [Pseudohalocynthiibacter aestuariivivens]
MQKFEDQERKPERMKVVEKTIASRSGELFDCEDALVITKEFIAVIDGSTSKYPTLGKVTPGKLIAEELSEAVKALPQRATCDEAIELFSDRVQLQSATRSNENNETATASIVVLSCFRREIWRVGDCNFRVNNKIFNQSRKLEQHIAAVRAAYNQVALFSGSSVGELMKKDLGRELVLPLLRNQSVFMNKATDSPFSFGAINGAFVPKIHRETVVLPNEPCDVVLCSDGYPKTLATLEASERYLEKILQEDPLCISKFFATKGMKIGSRSFDDRTYIRVRV